MRDGTLTSGLSISLVILAGTPLRAGEAEALKPPLRFPVRNPVCAEAGDWNGDGRRDFASGTIGGDLHVFLAGGGPEREWLPVPPLKVGESAFFLRAADFDADGDDDLLAADLYRTVLFLRSEGDGSFAEPRALREAEAPRWIALGDWEKDGKLDFATANTHSRSLTTFRGSGSGEFTFLGQHLFDPHFPHCVEALDYDGDGLADLMAGVPGVGIQPFRGDGGAFAAQPPFANLGGVRYLRGGDLNGDGRGDLGSSLGLAGVSLGDGTYRVVASLESGPGAIISPNLADFDGDGHPDVAFTQTGSVALHRGRGDGEFEDEERFELATQYAYLTGHGDLDDDGRADLLVADIDGSEVLVLHGGEPSTPAGFRRGDVDASGTVGITDAVLVLRRLFLGGAPLACDDAADADDDGRLSVTDAVASLRWLFQGGVAPPDPGPETCGGDPTPDDLACGAEGCK